MATGTHRFIDIPTLPTPEDYSVTVSNGTSDTDITYCRKYGAVVCLSIGTTGTLINVDWVTVASIPNDVAPDKVIPLVGISNEAVPKDLLVKVDGTEIKVKYSSSQSVALWVTACWIVSE